MATKSYRELIVWQKAHAFVLKVYSCTEKFPKDELYGLTSQFRRAAVSIAANIAEGYAKKSVADKMRFFNISQGSLEECSYYIILSKDLLFINNEQTSELDELSNDVRKLLQAYIVKLKS